MIVYVISGGPRSGKSTLARRLGGPLGVWDMFTARHFHRDAFLPILRDRLLESRRILSPRIVLDGIETAQELAAIREMLPHDEIVHYHISSTDSSIPEPTDEMLNLGLMADYAVSWGLFAG